MEITEGQVFYIPVVENDQGEDTGGPVACGSYLKQASEENAMEHLKKLNGKRGKGYIAELKIIKEYNNE